MAHNAIPLLGGKSVHCINEQQMAEAQFGTGDVPIAELARVTEIAAKARSDYETARSEYLNAYQKLESLVGMPLEELVSEQ